MPPWLVGSAVAAFGLIFILVGVFGKDFQWGEYGGPPAPKGLGKAFFIILGLIFAIAGIVGAFK